MSKDDKKEIYQTKYHYTTEEQYKLLKAIPDLSISYYLIKTLLVFPLFTIIASLLSFRYVFLFSFLACVIYSVILRLLLPYQLKKSNKEEQLIEICVYDSYFLIKTNFRESKTFFGYFDKVVETDTNFYFYNTKERRFVILLKKELDSSMIKFIKTKFENIEDRTKDRGKNDSQNRNSYLNKRKRFILNLLFVLTILAVFVAAFIIGGSNDFLSFSIEKNFILLWSLLPFPILSIVFGYKYRRSGINTSKNITAGFLVGIMFFVMGLFSFSVSTQKENLKEYEEIMGVTMPDSSTYVSSYEVLLSDSCTDCFTFNVHFLEDGISVEGENWVSYSDLDIKFQEKFEDNKYKESSYFMVYNKTKGEYNTVSDENNLYYFIMYNPKHKKLDIIGEEICFNE